MMAESYRQFLIATPEAKTARPRALADMFHRGGGWIKLFGKKRLGLPAIDIHPLSLPHASPCIVGSASVTIRSLLRIGQLILQCER